MTTGTEPTTRTQGDPGRLQRPRNTLAFPPPQQSPTLLPAKSSSLSDGQPVIKDFFLDESSTREDPWEGLFDEAPPPRRRWPAVIAFSITGLVVTLIGVAAVGRLRQTAVANAGPTERALEPRQEQTATQQQTTTEPHRSPGAVLRVDAVIDTKKPQLPSVDEEQLAQPASPAVKPNADPTVPRPPPPPPAAQLAASIGQHFNSAIAKAPSGSPTPIAEKPARPTPALVPRRAVRQKITSHSNKSTSKPQTEAEPSIPVDQIYLNKRGELVDAQGKPLPSNNKERAQSPGSDVEAQP